MSRLKVAFIGTGIQKGSPGSTGYGMAYQHGDGYKLLPDEVEMVAACDLVKERADAFAANFGFERSYTDYHQMLAEEEPDLVSVCTWPASHAAIVTDIASAGMRAIHCEKPIAQTWGDCKRTVAACDENGVKLTFNHMRRFGKPFRQAKALVDSGRIGELRFIESGMGNLCDYGSHNFDMCGYFNDQTPCEWVMAQIDYVKESRVFGAHQENTALAMWKYENGVFGFQATGMGDGGFRNIMGAYNRLIGTEGVIEIEAPDAMLRVRSDSDAAWEVIDCEGEHCHGPGYNDRAIADVVRAAAGDGTSELCAANVLQSTEIIFACWESSRRRGMVHLPLDIEDNPLEAMVESGALNPAPKE